MSIEAIRVDVVTRVEAVRSAFSGGYPLVVEYDNRVLVDTKTQTDPFLAVEVKLLDASQIDLSLTPTHRFWGQIVFKAYSMEGAGTSKANNLLEHFYKGTHRSAFGKVRTLVASPGPTTTHLGWECRTMFVTFWSDQAT